MPERRDPFESLGRPITPTDPGTTFAAALRRRLEQELGMDERTMTTEVRTGHGRLAMVHLRVADADRAMGFFGELFGWEAERIVYEGHVNHYTLNTAVTVRLIGDPSGPAVVPNYHVDDVAAAIRAIDAGRGRISSSSVSADGGGWAQGVDDQGVPLLVYRPRSDHRRDRATGTPRGEVGVVFIREDAGRAHRFYREVLGWHLAPAHPGSEYYETDTAVGVFDETAAFGSPTTPSAVLYVSVPALRPVLQDVERLGGTAGVAARDMGELFSAMCADDQGTEFGLIAPSLD